MDIQTLNWIIIGIFGLFFAWGRTKVSRLQDEIKSAREERDVQIEELRSDIRLKEKAQEATAQQFQTMMDLISKQIEVGNKMAENLREDIDQRFELEQKRHDLIMTFTKEQSSAKDAIEVLSGQIGKVTEGIRATANDAKAATLMNIETNKLIVQLKAEIKTNAEKFGQLEKMVTESLEKIIQQPLAENIRNAVKDAEKAILERIDTLKKEQTEQTIAYTEVKTDEKFN